MARGAEAKKARKEARKNARLNPDSANASGGGEGGDGGGFGEDFFGSEDTYDVGGGDDDKKKKAAAAAAAPVVMSDGDDPFGFKRAKAADQKRSKGSCCDGDDCDDDDKPVKKASSEPEDEVMKKIKKGKKREKALKLEQARAAKGFFGDIKLLPLLFLLLLTGSTILPATFWLLDNAGPLLGSTNLTGKLGYRLGVGATPRKRVTSFYEKHAPEKIHEVDNIVSKYYGDYKTLTRKLERKYQDYGYFVGWEQDEAPSKLALSELDKHMKSLKSYYRKKAPPALVQISDNVMYNVGGLVKQGKKVWFKSVWPVLKPIIWVADEKDAKRQKMEDKKKYGKKGGKGGRRKRNSEFRDEEED
eukprot:CAMPEP_0118650158 /NCGR_PEP_ID=MMETSP0785-20121206/10096_1 /TAXON_ID=91992 /ORGANISM="Bolidomonas pacifica, Strain CCMP 1866" /LENGTH=358 /DNA_ID=CAMNT_0006542511 /DNA_START=155 /DNA_END=1231 /DNA_ORIENTATION=-